MTPAGFASTLAILAAFSVAGLVFGLAYFAALRRTVDLYRPGGGRVLPLFLTFGRLAGAILFLAFAVQFGALPLLAAFLGFLLARGLALHAARGSA